MNICVAYELQEIEYCKFIKPEEKLVLYKSVLEKRRKNNILDKAIKGEANLENEVNKLFEETLTKNSVNLPFIVSESNRRKAYLLDDCVGNLKPIFEDSYFSQFVNIAMNSVAEPVILAIVGFFAPMVGEGKEINRRNFLSATFFGGIGAATGCDSSQTKEKSFINPAKENARYIHSIIQQVYQK